jgi:hypothetical protein
MKATDSDPVYQDEIPGGNNEAVPTEPSRPQNPENGIGDTPITKDDLKAPTGEEKTESDIANNPATDLMNRINNLNKDQD